MNKQLHLIKDSRHSIQGFKFSTVQLCKNRNKIAEKLKMTDFWEKGLFEALFSFWLDSLDKSEKQQIIDTFEEIRKMQ